MKTSNWAPLMERTASKRKESSLAVGVVGLLHKCQATNATATMLPIRRSPPSSYLRLSVSSMVLFETNPNSTTNARVPPPRIQSSPLLDPATTPA